MVLYLNTFIYLCIPNMVRYSQYGQIIHVCMDFVCDTTKCLYTCNASHMHGTCLTDELHFTPYIIGLKRKCWKTTKRKRSDS